MRAERCNGPGRAQGQEWPAEHTCPLLQAKHDCDRWAASTGGAWRTREVTLDPGVSADTPVKPRTRPEPARTGRGPSPARCVLSPGSAHDRAYTWNELGRPQRRACDCGVADQQSDRGEPRSKGSGESMDAGQIPRIERYHLDRRAEPACRIAEAADWRRSVDRTPSTTCCALAPPGRAQPPGRCRRWPR
jgi:hypothetical protein